jgi:hypothetical protein
MAFSTAAGYGNLPNGNFSPIIYSKQVQLAFRKSSIVEAITNSDYFGEIANMGDSVKVIKEPEITVKSYARGTTITPQDLDDEEFSLTIDKANYFAFKVDDIEEAHSHVNFSSLASDRAAYRLSDQFDQEVLGYMSGFKQSAIHGVADTVNTTVNGVKAVSTASDGANLVGAELLASMSIDASDFTQTNGTAGTANQSIGLEPRAGGATAAKSGTTGNAFPLQVIARMARLLDQQNVDTQGRWLVLDPVFIEILKDEDSRLLNSDFGGSGLQNGLVLNNLHGFQVYTSNNLPTLGTGPSTTGGSNASNFGIIVAGHSSAVATAEQINKTESYRDPDSFADIALAAGDVIPVIAVKKGTMVMNAGIEVDTQSDGSTLTVDLGMIAAEDFIDGFDGTSAAGVVAQNPAAYSPRMAVADDNIDLKLVTLSGGAVTTGKFRIWAVLMDCTDIGDMSANEVDRDTLA